MTAAEIERLQAEIMRLRAQLADTTFFLGDLAFVLDSLPRCNEAEKAAEDCRAWARKLRGET